MHARMHGLTSSTDTMIPWAGISSFDDFAYKMYEKDIFLARHTLKTATYGCSCGNCHISHPTN